jgi:hypothetical protein
VLVDNAAEDTRMAPNGRALADETTDDTVRPDVRIGTDMSAVCHQCPGLDCGAGLNATAVVDNNAGA